MCACEIDEYLENYTNMKSLTSLITFDEIIDTLRTESINSNDKTATYKMDYYILHSLLSVTILLLIIITFY